MGGGGEDLAQLWLRLGKLGLKPLCAQCPLGKLKGPSLETQQQIQTILMKVEIGTSLMYCAMYGVHGRVWKLETSCLETYDNCRDLHKFP